MSAEWLANIIVPLFFALIGLLWGLLMDKPKRWAILGYTPTVIAVLFEKTNDTVWVLLEKVNDEWCFPQGRLQKEGMVASLEAMLMREVGIAPNYYKPISFEILGVLPSKNTRPNLEPYSAFSLSRTSKGKGYIYTLCSSLLKSSESLHKKLNEHYCFEIQDRKIVTIEDAKVYLNLEAHSKKEFYRQIFEHLSKC